VLAVIQQAQRSRFWPVARDLGLVLLLYAGVRAYQHRALPSGPAPELAGGAVAGGELSLRAYRGRPVLLHFWASWCGVCEAEQSNIVALAQGLPVLTVATQSGTGEQLRAYAKLHHLSFPIISDPTGELARRYGVAALPTTFILDAAGRIRHAEVGYTTQLGLRLRMWLATR
jgi:peroxiredoxin